MNDDQLLRYSRHILLDEIGIEGQERILAAHVLILGAGGLGSPAALYLAAAGVGRLTIVDDDAVDLTNLQRQIAHDTASVGLPKVESMRRAISALNPDVQVRCVQQRADRDLLDALVPEASVVLDCCDNYRTRQLVNASCVAHGVPLVEGAAIRFDGQLMAIDPRDAQSACYACIFPPEAQFEEVQCSTMGVFSPMVGIIGTMQAALALKLVVGIDIPLPSQLSMLDGHSMQWSHMKLARSPSCPVCAGKTPAAKNLQK